MLATIDPFQIGSFIGLAIAGIIAALNRRQLRPSKKPANGEKETLADKIDRIDARHERLEAKVDGVGRELHRHIEAHIR